MKFWQQGWLYFFMALFSQALYADEELSWRACIDKTISGNKELRAAYETLKSSQYSAKAAESGFYPQVTGGINYNHGSGSVSASPGSTTSSISNGNVQDNYSVSLSATQNLFNGFQDKAKVDQATSQSKVQEATLANTKAQVSYNLKSAYAGLLYSNRSVTLQQDIIHRREENLKLVQLRFQSGGENKGSVLLSEAYLNQANYDALQARNGVSVQQSSLAQIFGRDDEMYITVNEDVPLEDPPATPNFYQIAMNAPAYLQAVAQENYADAGLAISRSGYFPTLSLNASTGRVGQDWFPQDDRWMVGATISVPLFNGGRDYYGSKSAYAALDAATATRDDTGKLIVAKLKQAYNSYIEARQKLKVDESFREAALKRAEIARSKYNNGLMNFEDWDLIESDLIARQKAVLQSELNLVVAEAAWQLAQGIGVLP